MLGDPTRRLILERLAVCPSSVVDLASEVPVSRPAVSQHLRLLKDAGIVRARAEGTRRIYEVDAARLARYRRELDKFWGSTLVSFVDATDTGRSRPDNEQELLDDPPP